MKTSLIIEGHHYEWPRKNITPGRVQRINNTVLTASGIEFRTIAKGGAVTNMPSGDDYRPVFFVPAKSAHLLPELLRMGLPCKLGNPKNLALLDAVNELPFVIYDLMQESYTLPDDIIIGQFSFYIDCVWTVPYHNERIAYIQAVRVDHVEVGDMAVGHELPRAVTESIRAEVERLDWCRLSLSVNAMISNN
jgi:hypothetical protein